MYDRSPFARDVYVKAYGIRNVVLTTSKDYDSWDKKVGFKIYMQLECS